MDYVSCKYCFKKHKRNDFDWKNRIKVKIDTDYSWGIWKLIVGYANNYSYFVKCPACKQLAVSDGSIEKSLG